MTVKELKDMLSNDKYDNYVVFAESTLGLIKPNGIIIDSEHEEICINYEE